MSYRVHQGTNSYTHTRKPTHQHVTNQRSNSPTKARHTSQPTKINTSTEFTPFQTLLQHFVRWLKRVREAALYWGVFFSMAHTFPSQEQLTELATHHHSLVQLCPHRKVVVNPIVYHHTNRTAYRLRFQIEKEDQNDIVGTARQIVLSHHGKP